MTYIPTTHKFVAVSTCFSRGTYWSWHALCWLHKHHDGWYIRRATGKTKVTPEAELEYWGIVTFGEVGKLSALTKKFSLWRS